MSLLLFLLLSVIQITFIFCQHTLVQKMYTATDCIESSLFAIASMEYGTMDTDHSGYDGCEEWAGTWTDWNNVTRHYFSSYKTECEIKDNGDHIMTYKSWWNITGCPDDIPSDHNQTEKINVCINEGGTSRFGWCEMEISSSMQHVTFYNKTIYDGCIDDGVYKNRLFEVWFMPNQCFYFDLEEFEHRDSYSMYVHMNTTYLSPREYASENCDPATETWREEYIW